MVNVRSLTLISTYLLLIKIFKCRAIYEDQVGKFDWKLSYIGKVKYATIDTKRIVVATEENVVAAVHPRNGVILWRQILEKPDEQQVQLLTVDKEVITVSGSESSWFVRGWDLNSGTVLWEWYLHSKNATDNKWFIESNKLYHVGITLDSHLEITNFQLQTGEQQGNVKFLSLPLLTDLSRCALSKTYWICISSEDNSRQLYYLSLLDSGDKVLTFPLNSLVSGSATDFLQITSVQQTLKPTFLLSTHNVTKVIIIENHLPRVLLQTVLHSSRIILTGSKLLQLQVNPNNPEKLITIKGINLYTGADESAFDVQYPLGLGAPHFVNADCHESMSCDLLLCSSDNALTLVKLPEGKVSWTREEALSNIVAVEFLELPVSESEATIENEFKSISGDVFSMFYARLISQIRQFLAFLPTAQLLSTNSGGLVRDEFGIHKLAIVATAVGKLFAIDTLSGSIVWSYRLPNVIAFSKLNSENVLFFTQRTTRHAPLPAQSVLIAKDATTGKGILFTFDPITGYSTLGIEKMNYYVKQAMMLPYEGENHLKPLLILAKDNKVYVYPSSSKQLINQNKQAIFLYVADTRKLSGYSLTYSTLNEPKVSLVWDLYLGQSEMIGLSVRPPLERVHSQGRVLPDRSVYYKYVNPNLIAVATQMDDMIHKHAISIYIIDGITGLVVYSVSHKRAKGPVHIVHSENWLVYSYFSERFRRYEMAAVELYEGEEQSNNTIFSSHAVSWLPYAETQSYILPVTPLTMCTTLTERGITNKFLLVGLSNGMITQIPWALLEPRLSNFACGPEESCIPYIPEIPVPPEASLNYNQSLSRIRGIRVAPARLESTSHVLIYGLDVFYTRVAPSKTFDMLKEDFDHRLIILVLTALIVSSYVTKRLASRKALRQLWK